MDAAELYRQHGDECREMANLVRDVDSRASWRRIAERWFRYAEREEARYARSRRAEAAGGASARYVRQAL